MIKLNTNQNCMASTYISHANASVITAQLKQLKDFENNINLISISCVYDKKHKSEGIKIEWQLDDKNYESIEYIKQRIIDE